MPPGEAEKVRGMGLGEPCLELRKREQQFREDGLGMPDEPSWGGESGNHSERADALSVVMARVRAAQNPLLFLDVLCRALWVPDVAELSLQALADRHGVSRQRVHAVQTEIISTWNLPAPPRLRRRAADRRRMGADAARRGLDKFKHWLNDYLSEDRKPEELRAAAADLRWFSSRHDELTSILGKE